MKTILGYVLFALLVACVIGYAVLPVVHGVAATMSTVARIIRTRN